MGKYFALNYRNDPFHLFSTEHLVTMIIILIFGVGIFIFQKSLRRHTRLISYSLATLLLFSEISLHLWYLSHHVWSIRHALPLELSDITVLITIVMLLTKSAGLFRFLYFAGIGSSIQAILTPDLKIYSFPHFRYIEFFVSHGGVFLACLFVAGVIQYKPTFRSLWVSILIIDIYGACIFLFDRAIHANYLFLIKKPETASILNFLGPWPWYLLSVEIAMIIIFLILYWPYWIIRKVKRG